MGCCILYVRHTCVTWAVASSLWAVASSIWAIEASMHDAQTLCGMLYPLTLTLTIIKVQCMAQNPNPTTVAATCRLFRLVEATVVGLEFLDTAL